MSVILDVLMALKDATTWVDDAKCKTLWWDLSDAGSKEYAELLAALAHERSERMRLDNLRAILEQEIERIGVRSEHGKL